jgi:hypothetical protein
VPTLRELQAAFAASLLGEHETGVTAHIAADGLAPAARLQIYRHHVFTSLTAALEATYAVVARLVDARFFAYAAHEYVRRHPPTGPCLFEYGASFADFLAGFPPCASLPYLPDVACLEWAIHIAGNADDAAPVDPGRLGGIASAEVRALRLHLHPSLSVLQSPWPVADIWRANQPDADADLTVDLAAGGVCLEVLRRNDDVVLRVTTPATHAFVRALREGRGLSDAAAAARTIEPGFDLAAVLCRLLDDGLVVAVEPASYPRDEPTLTPMETER